MHAGLGIGIPYGNADVIPYEKRFYSGGANSVRGWGESKLGPGVYKRTTGTARDYNQAGDIKLDLNMALCVRNAASPLGRKLSFSLGVAPKKWNDVWLAVGLRRSNASDPLILNPLAMSISFRI